MQPDYQATAKLLNLPQDARDMLWAFRHPQDEEPKLTYVDILAKLPSLFGVSSSLAALSYFYKEEGQIRDMLEAQAFAERAKLEMIKDPEMTPEAAARWAQFVFTTRVARDGNIKGFVALEKTRATHLQIELDQQKFALIKAKADRLDAAQEVMGSSLTTEEQNRRIREILK